MGRLKIVLSVLALVSVTNAVYVGSADAVINPVGSSAPAAPTGLAIHFPSTFAGGVVTWNAVSGATEYAARIKDYDISTGATLGSSGWAYTVHLEADIPFTDFPDLGDSPPPYYKVQVKAINAYGSSSDQTTFKSKVDWNGVYVGSDSTKGYAAVNKVLTCMQEGEQSAITGGSVGGSAKLFSWLTKVGRVTWSEVVVAAGGTGVNRFVHCIVP